MVMQYWLGGSDTNIESMLRFLISRYCRIEAWQNCAAAPPEDYPEVGLYHPDLPGKMTTDITALPVPQKPVATVGLLLMRSYVLSDDTAHYDAVIRNFEANGLKVIPAFAGGLDARPAIEGYFQGTAGVQIDAMVSLTGFSLVGGPAYNNSQAAIALLENLDVPYIAAHPLEFK